MADDAERRLLEDQLELQLQEQRDSIAELDEALASDPNNPEILEVHSELLQAIKDAEEGLFVLKRARLLQEVDFSLQMAKDGAKGVNQDSLASKDVEVEPLEEAEDVNQDLLDSKDAEVEPLKEYSVGSKCRFRHSDGRWYDGLIVAMEGSTGAKVSFLTPTSENQLVCKFFLQQRCRFGMKCRSSHGIDLPLSSLKKYNPTIWNQSLVGSTVWATSDSKTGIWREAELESWDDKLKLGRVVFRDDGSSLNVGNESISLSEYAQMSDEDDSDDSYSESDHYDPTDYEIEDSSEGIGFLGSSNLQRGIQTETAIFAKWENHTRGIASKMMANMGFREGMGLGLKGQGRIDPISVKVLPPKQSLDHALESVENRDTQEKKRSRGGKRKRDKKFAAAVRAAKQQEEPSSDIFSLINTQLAMHDEALKSGSGKKQQKKEFQAGKNGERRALVAFDDEVKELRARVQKLEEMASRNKKEKVVYDAALRKLHETQKTLAEVEAAHASASNAVANKEKEKRWLKF
ncbi:zinc finger CCCH domain-containing protein 18 [Cynara cardunculus var. scolymus]|uniref:zinc finger CCCH domain-containing protein 18 n=1 Tax=Cynara cardunculus var. scolymus TaxID=59895 RepID=UPI000D62392B|nr:zinc finger CCCH domain-containing protein 18 [Cynara cardunculus var. scolymus]XP_024996837.1 zinc finger CCCH domain-containing protein 18 [Cynara cardunculus var. scolymus]